MFVNIFRATPSREKPFQIPCPMSKPKDKQSLFIIDKHPVSTNPPILAGLKYEFIFHTFHPISLCVVFASSDAFLYSKSL